MTRSESGASGAAPDSANTAPGPPLRLLVVLERYPPVLGSDRRIVELASRLGAAYRVAYLVVPPLLGPPSPAPTAEPPGVVRLPEARARNVVLAPVLLPLNLVRAVTRGSSIPADVIVANHPSVTTGLAALGIARLSSRPLVVDFNDLIAQYTMDLLGLKSGVLRRALVRIQSLILSRASGILLATGYLRGHLPASHAPAVVIPNAASLPDDPAAEPPKDIHRPFRLAYAGRFEPWAGSGFLEGLVRELLRRGIDAELRVAGNVEPREAEGIRFVGLLKPDAVGAFLRDSDVILVPFPPGATSEAASPIKLFEAWAAGRPVLASDVSGVREVCEDGVNAWLLPPDEVGPWAGAVGRLSADADLRERMSEAALRAARGATWEARAAVLSAFLRELFPARPGAMGVAATDPGASGGPSWAPSSSRSATGLTRTNKR